MTRKRSSSAIDESAGDLEDNIAIENLPNLDNSAKLKSFLNSVLPTGVPVNKSVSGNVRSALEISSNPSLNSTTSSFIFGDNIRSDVEASALFESTIDRTPYYLSIDRTLNSSNSNPLASDKLFISNITYAATEKELKDFFQLRNFNVISIDLPNKNKRPGNGGTGFFRFNSIETAEAVLNAFKIQPISFRFKGRDMKINRPKLPQHQNKRTISIQSTIDNTSDTAYFDISNVLYGAFIKSETVNNLVDNNYAKEFGLIGHRLINNERNTCIRLRINSLEKKIAIIVTYSHDNSTASTELIFEWAFGSLQGEKISPVLINNRDVALLIQVKQPPVILQRVSDQTENSGHETRVPGTPLIGQANAWFFNLSSKTIDKDYRSLFKILGDCNLTPQYIQHQDVVRLIYPLRTAQAYLRHVNVLSNDRWMKDNREWVDHFLDNRWPRYPFEIKFEIRKLLSKHIITIHDLIIDEQFDQILAKCSINTVITCTDIITAYAPRWLQGTCDYDEDDWTEKEEFSTTESQPMLTDETENDVSITVQTAMGQSINDINTESVFSTENIINRLNMQSQRGRLGNLSWFFIQALRHLKANHKLQRTVVNKIFMTKHELHPIRLNSMLVRKIYITPSTILYEGPYEEEKCLVTRQFTQVQDGFLRVCFRDEDYKKLQNTGSDLRKLYDRIKAILIKGINICDRQYDFLAFSSSQLRDHCCWMFSSMNGISAESIRDSMGDFRNIHPVAKMAARLGQSFSTTKRGLELKDSQYHEIPDVESNKLCLTDGIGIIAPWLAKELSKELGLDDSLGYPSAFQIRFSGYKGMVCLDTINQLSNSDIGLYLRPSMNKFDSKNRAIAVVRVSSVPSSTSLNRQIILLLSSLGIKDEIFRSMQNQMLHDLTAITTDHKKAQELLRKMGGSGGNGYHSFLSEYLKRFCEKMDPFAREILVALQGFLVKELRTKARILVPNTWTLLGVIDETKTLKYGQVFIQIEEKDENGVITSKIITGPVVVTRNPCFHPGDIRRLEAVDVPVLHPLKNVIVFPLDARGSHPAEMSGGDLDGDTFWVSQEKVFLFEANEQPFDYHEQADEDSRQIVSHTTINYTIHDVCRFFVEYIEADNLGTIANSHMAFADQSLFRARGSECLKLARMHSTAVDFAKNGVSAPRLTQDLRPTQYPHFMENNYKSNYTSTTILGQLYDQVKKFEACLHREEQQNNTETNSFPYHQLVIDGSDAYMADAASTKHKYDEELQRVMRQYGIRNEAELVSGYILQLTAKQYAKQAKIADMKNEINHAVKIIQDKYLRIFYEDIYVDMRKKQESNDDVKEWSEASKKLSWKKQIDWFENQLKTNMLFTSESEIAKKASAWFRVTYQSLYDQLKPETNKKTKRDQTTDNEQVQQQQQQNRKRSRHFLSFAWIVYPILLKIFDEKTKAIE